MNRNTINSTMKYEIPLGKVCHSLQASYARQPPKIKIPNKCVSTINTMVFHKQTYKDTHRLQLQIFVLLLRVSIHGMDVHPV